MRYYKLTVEGEDVAFIESKRGLTDPAAKREAVDQHLLDTVEAEIAEVFEIDEEEYEMNV